jgi:CrcB protein
MERLAWVCLGSAIGGGARYLISGAALRWLGAGFPYGTLAVNLLGCFLMGLAMQLVVTTSWISPSARLFLVPGVMGGLTTYSAFNYETLRLATDSGWGPAAANLALMGVGCLAAGLAGLLLGRLLAGD